MSTVRQGGRGVVPSRNEHTIAASCSVEGRGYWSGDAVRVTIHPASAGHGVQWLRSDLESAPPCPAHVSRRVDAALRTNLVSGDTQYEMVEHLMAALYALEIDNCLVEINGSELPGLDGSSRPYVDALRHAGLIVQANARQRLTISERIRVGNSSGWIEATPCRGTKASYEYQLSFDQASPIPNQRYRVELTPRSFTRELASARTFVTEQQARQIRDSGLASHVSNQDLLVIGEAGPIENEYRFTNECARHKTLDLIGDLALAGVELIGTFVSFRGGHQLNGQMASRLADLAASQSTNAAKPFQNRSAA